MKTYLALLAVLLSPMAANAVVIIDTGTTGAAEPESDWALYENQWLAGQFTTTDDYTITSIEGWISTIVVSGDLTAAIYADSAGLPSAELYSMAFSSTGTTESWQGLTGLTWDILAGTYYVAFEVRGGQSFVGTLPGTAVDPLPGYAFTESGVWTEFDALDSSFRIMGDLLATVPEPGTLALLGLGLAGLGLKRRGFEAT